MRRYALDISSLLHFILDVLHLGLVTFPELCILVKFTLSRTITFISLCPLQGNLRQDANYLRHNMKDFPLNEVVAECEEYVQRLRSLAVEVSHH